MKEKKTVSPAVRRFFKNKPAVAALAVFLVIVFCCVFAPVVTKYDYSEMNVADRYLVPSSEHLFGCDFCGRDIFSRVLYGGRITLRIALTATLISGAIGISLGIISGFASGFTDTVIMRLMEVLSAVPTLLLVVIVECLLGWGQGYFMYALAIAAAPSLVRLTRSSVRQVMEKPFTEAARALGVRPLPMIFRHIVPNIISSLFVHLTGTFADQILNCTVMGYLGIGINPPAPEWGLLVSDGYASIRLAPFSAVCPAIVIALCVLSVNVVGNGLRDAVDGGGKSDG